MLNAAPAPAPSHPPTSPLQAVLRKVKSWLVEAKVVTNIFQGKYFMSKQVNSKAEACGGEMCGGREGLFCAKFPFSLKGTAQAALFLNIQ